LGFSDGGVIGHRLQVGVYQFDVQVAAFALKREDEKKSISGKLVNFRDKINFLARKLTWNQKFDFWTET